MSYQSFLFVSSQLRAGRPAHSEWEDFLIIFELIDGDPNRWRISTILFQGEDCIPSEIQSCVFSSGILHWQTQGPYIKYDAKIHSVLLVFDFANTNSFISFRRSMQNFVSIAKEWKEVLSSVSCTKLDFVRFLD